MKYYKIIQDNNFIGVICSTDFITYQLRNHCFITSDETHGEFVEYNGKLYHSSWMLPVPNEISHTFEQVVIIEIDEEEYNTFKQAIDNDEEIIDNNEEEQIPIIINDDTTEEISIEFLRNAKLNEMSYACRIAIENGFDLELRGEMHHFSLTTQDQLNLMSLSTMTQTQSLIPYHADGEECTFYTAEEINQIINAAASFKNYQIAYHNALKTYINALDTIEAIAAITYGTPIPDEYKTDVLMVLE